MKVIVDHIQRDAPDIQTISFKKPDTFRYTAGQFIELYLPHDDADQRGQKRWFTLSSAPTRPLLAITTRNFGTKGSSFKKRLFALKPGDHVEMSEPMGDFVLPKDATIPLVFVAGGIGVTPFHSIVQWLSDTDEQRQIQMLYAAENQQELVFLELFRKYDLELQTITNERLTAESIVHKAEGVDNKFVFISGPEPMTETLVDQFKNIGFPYERLVTDYFPGYPTL